MSEHKIKVWAFLMTQYNMKSGLWKFRAKGATVTIDELMQLHIMDTWMVMNPSKLSREDKVKVLSSLLFLKEKGTLQIKGQACVNGVPQRAYIPKEDATLPTVSTKSLFMTAVTAASKKRKVRISTYPALLCTLMWAKLYRWCSRVNLQR
jgi:hypothetical protein